MFSRLGDLVLRSQAFALGEGTVDIADGWFACNRIPGVDFTRQRSSRMSRSRGENMRIESTE